MQVAPAVLRAMLPRFPSLPMHPIELRGARTNNLKQLDLTLEPGTFVVLCGPSGAGKSSLAFGTLYAEGQRRYVESFSAYARQFLERRARPPIEALEHMPAAIAIDRVGTVKTSRSTVATLTELSDYFKQLFALLATTECAACGGRVRSQSVDSAVERVIDRLAEQKVVITYPVAIAQPEDLIGVREALLRDGYRRVLVGPPAAGEVRELESVKPSELGLRARGGAGSTLHVVVDRARASRAERSRLFEALDAALARGEGHASVQGERATELVSLGFACEDCGRPERKPSPGLFSWNNPIGACEICRGFGRTIGVDFGKVFADRRKTLAEGAIKPWSGKSTTYERKLLARHCKRAGIPMDRPLAELSEAQMRSLIEGDGGNWRTGFPGLRRWFSWLESRAYKMHVRVLLSRYRSYETCAACEGRRLKPEALRHRVQDTTLAELFAMPVDAARAWTERLSQDPAHDETAKRVLRECHARLSILCEVGVSYLALDRSARSLSGGELQRVALTSALGSGLSGTLFVLDEPTVGLHPADVEPLLAAVTRLAHDDNVVLAVESDERFLRGADRVIELGPASGPAGGQLVLDTDAASAPGSSAVASSLEHADTATARALRGEGLVRRRERRPASGALVLTGARGHNLTGIDLELLLGVLTCITGVSGSGKSSLVRDTLVPALQRALRAEGLEGETPLPFDELRGHEAIAKLVVADQAPLGRTSRGNAATYLGAWDSIRKRLAKQPLAIERGYSAAMFSFNVQGGRCEACKGEGSDTVEMQFLADVTFSCPECQGRRFAGPVLDITLCGHNVAEILELTALEASQRFAELPEIVKSLAPLIEVGGGYLRLGQPLSTLSGGEAQRLRLAEALGSVQPGTLLVLDEPTAGLHASDTPVLLACFDRLIDSGATLLVIEHDMHVAAHADHVIELGPGAGEHGGHLVAAGTPEQVAGVISSPTGRYLRTLITAQSEPTRFRWRPRAPRAAAGTGTRISVHGASEHNLKHVDVTIPRDQLVVVTGPSGSGKSTLAFDVVFAEAQRRYLDTLSPYVRQYLAELPRAQVDRIDGTPPAVALEQQQTLGARSSTVATVTEVAHHLRVAFARAGELHCESCALPIAPRSFESLCQDIAARFGAARVEVLAPIVRGKKGAHRVLLQKTRARGVTHVVADGARIELRAGLSLDRYKEHDVLAVLGAAGASSAELRPLLKDALEQGNGAAFVHKGHEQLACSTERACPRCGRGYPELDPRFFSFNTRQGACPTCEGKGVVESERSGKSRTFSTCPACDGRRLSGLSLHTKLFGHRIDELLERPVAEARALIEKMPLAGKALAVAGAPLAEAVKRLGFLERVGLGYLSLDRGADSLSGGELQRARLAGQLGSGLSGVLYVLDEPTIGLHPRDSGRLIAALRSLVAEGCSVLVVEHDEDTIRAADHLIDVGPVGGREGGHVVAAGPAGEVLRDPSSVTGTALAAPRVLREQRRALDQDTAWLELRGAREHNLKDVTARFPLGRLTAVTGVSGSGKSTLVREVLLRSVQRALGRKGEAPGAHAALAGADRLSRAVEIDQTPIGRTPRSVPATYIGIFDDIRALYAKTPEARVRGYDAARFSFNVAKGRCPVCEGQGSTTVEMSFLPDAQLRCEQCAGLRYAPETLAVTLHGKSIGELLLLSVAEAAELLAPFSKVRRPLELLSDLGLSYLSLGQASNTLSGGEAQRLKLVSELSVSGAGRTLYVMDEPTTGLHASDVTRLLSVLDALVDRGDTVIVIEHQPELIAAADFVIDLGPEGGAEGGRIVAEGTPEAIMKSPASHTGRALAALYGAPLAGATAAVTTGAPASSSPKPRSRVSREQRSSRR